MATATVAGFKELFPVIRNPLLSSATDDHIEAALDEAMLIHAVRVKATYFCAAHLIVQDSGITTGSAPSTEVKSRTAGPISAVYATQGRDQTSDVFFTSTPYGRRFLVLEKRSARANIGARVV